MNAFFLNIAIIITNGNWYLIPTNYGYAISEAIHVIHIYEYSTVQRL